MYDNITYSFCYVRVLVRMYDWWQMCSAPFVCVLSRITHTTTTIILMRSKTIYPQLGEAVDCCCWEVCHEVVEKAEGTQRVVHPAECICTSTLNQVALQVEGG